MICYSRLSMFYLIFKTLASVVDIGFAPFPTNELYKVQLKINVNKDQQF